MKSKKQQLISIFSLLLPLVFFVLMACEKEEVAPSSQVDEALQVHFNRFLEEAAERGADYQAQVADLEGHIKEIERDGVVGQCHSSDEASNIVEVDEDFWQTASYTEREYVVFHELGHCVLGRGHSDGRTAAGICESIMYSGLTNCKVNYTASNRETYLDELFEN